VTHLVEYLVSRDFVESGVKLTDFLEEWTASKDGRVINTRNTRPTRERYARKEHSVDAAMLR
jgi:hypothetical protein